MRKKQKYSETMLKSYITDKSGQFAVWFGVAAFPILVATSMALDFRSTEANRDSIKRALDVAVLASVSNDKVDETGKKDIAIDVFKTHYHGGINLDLSVDVSDGRVEMTAEGTQEASLSRAVGNKGFGVRETSIAEMTRQNTICVLALAEDGKDKVRFLGDTEFNSPTCSVQSNSKDEQGILSATRNTPIAKSFCSAGGAKGEFKPAIRGECRVVEDPYKDREVPKSGVCMPTSIFASLDEDETDVQVTLAPGNNLGPGHEPWVEITRRPGNGNSDKHQHHHCHVNNPTNCHVGNHKISMLHMPSINLGRIAGFDLPASEVDRLVADYGDTMLGITESSNLTGDDSVFYPGTYCGGLTVDGQNVTFLPGVYIMKDGPLTFKNGASAYADEVSFVLKGEQSVVTVETGSYVWVKAPRKGEMAGMAFYQDRNGDAGETLGSGVGNTLPARRMSVKSTTSPTQPAGQDPNGPTAVNLISSGGELNVTGTMYFPTQALDVLGDSVLGARAPATSFIAHQVTFSGETKAAISVDHVSGGIPAMEPRSDDGARLVK